VSVENLRALVGYRLAQADEALEAARILLDADSLRASVNRAYYAMFYAILALMAVEREGTSKHAGVISFFNRAFVRTGQFPKVRDGCNGRSTCGPDVTTPYRWR